MSFFRIGFLYVQHVVQGFFHQEVLAGFQERMDSRVIDKKNAMSLLAK